MIDLEKDVLALVGRFTGQQVFTTSELYHDLHLYGDDAGELLDEVHKRYSTSFAGFEFGTYFPNETEALPRISKVSGLRDRKFGSFTVGHLMNVVRSGSWVEPA